MQYFVSNVFHNFSIFLTIEIWGYVAPVYWWIVPTRFWAQYVKLICLLLGYIQHKGKMQPYGRPYGCGSIVGVHLDMWKGTLQFYLNRKPLGKYSKCCVELLMTISRLLSSGLTSHSSIDRCQHFGGSYGYRKEKVGTGSVMVSCFRFSAFLIMFEHTDAITQTLCYMLGMRCSQQWLMITDFWDVVLYNSEEVHQRYRAGMYFWNVGELLEDTCRFLEVSTLHCITWIAKERK